MKELPSHMFVSLHLHLLGPSDDKQLLRDPANVNA